MKKEQLKRKLIDIRNGAMITPLLEELDANELKLRNEGRDFFKKELLLDIERIVKKGYPTGAIVSAIINLLK